jgi:lysophospholipase L1-like esterase
MNGQTVAMSAAMVACCLALSLWIAASAGHAAASRDVSSVLLVPRGPWRPPGPTPPHTVAGHTGTEMLVVPAPLAACEARLEREPRQVPTIAIVGASYTAGVGPGDPELSWAVDLARLLRWNAVVYGVAGAGYVQPGTDGSGPVARMLRAEELPGLAPRLVIVQAGHDDSGVPPVLEGRRVRAAMELIRGDAPGARIALLTVFTGPSLTGTPALRHTDHVIVAAAVATDPKVIIMDPLAGRWKFSRAHGNALHPSAAGDEWIARTVLAILYAHGVRAAPVTGTRPAICDVAVGAGKPASAVA